MSCIDDQRRWVAAIGGKSLRVYRLIVAACGLTFDLINETTTKDWIKAVHILNSLEDECNAELLLISAHNRVERYTLSTSLQFTPHSTIQCSERCILYAAACYGSSFSTCLIASGTVFGDILLWYPNQIDKVNEDVSVKSRLRSHEGVIFSLTFSPNGKFLASVSDDRSIRLWSVDDSTTPPQIFFGHIARVWQCALTDNLIVSVSEDCSCRIWSYAHQSTSSLQNEAIGCWEGHDGKNVWSVAINTSKSIVATGGNDTAIRLWNLDAVYSNAIEYEDQMVTVSAPGIADPIKNMLLFNDNYVFVSFQSGQLYTYELTGKIWSLIYSDDEFRGYAMLGGSACGQLVVAGSIHGHLCYMLMRQSSPIVHLSHSHHSKVYSVHVDHDPTYSNIFHVFAHLHPNTIAWSKVIINDNDMTVDHYAELKAQVTGLFCDMKMCHTYPVLVTAGRDGQLGVYWLAGASDKSQPCAPVVKLETAHSGEAVTSIAFLPQTNLSNLINFVTTGRDGTYCKWELCIDNNVGSYNEQEKDQIEWGKVEMSTEEDELITQYKREYLLSQSKRSNGDMPIYVCNQTQRVLRKFQADRNEISAYCENVLYSLVRIEKSKVTKGWLEKALLVHSELILIGFYQKRMFTFNLNSRYYALTVACGGANRKWGLYTQDRDLNDCTFCYIRKEKLMVLQRKCAPDVQLFLRAQLTPQFHGREVRCVRSLLRKVYTDTPRSLNVIFTGAEDTQVRATFINGDLISTYQKHQSVVRALAVSGDAISQPQNTYLFSAGGLEELIAWKVRCGSIVDNQASKLTPSVTLVEWSSCPPVSNMLESRVMSLATFSNNQYSHLHILIAGYSDGMVRVLLFDGTIRRFYVMAFAQLERCVLSVGCVEVQDVAFVLAGSTDGCIHIWEATSHINKFLHWYTQHTANTLLSIRMNKFRAHSTALSKPTTIYVHQSGVNALDITYDPSNHNNLTIATAGDDNAVACICIHLEKAIGEWTVVWHVYSPNAHASSVTGVQFLLNLELQEKEISSHALMVSVSVDQRVNIWRVKESDGSHQLVLLKSCFTHIADVSNMDVVCLGKRKWEVIVAGVGIQSFNIAL